MTPSRDAFSWRSALNSNHGILLGHGITLVAVIMSGMHWTHFLACELVWFFVWLGRIHAYLWFSDEPLIREPEMAQYGAQLPEDLAYHTALRMGRIASMENHGQEHQWVSLDSVNTVAWAPRRAARSSTAWYPYSVPETPFPSLAPKGTDEPT